MKKQRFYVTTPIYYPNSNLHIGHTYTTVLADAIARYKREMGYDVIFLTGTDDHGQKIQEAAEKLGQEPKEFVDGIVEGIKDLWEKMDISYDRFIRTTDDYHQERVGQIFQKLVDKGDIYLGEYEGHYCIPDESYWTDSQLVDGRCPTCSGEVVQRKEQSYFFKLSKYQDRLLQVFEDNPDILEPQSRINEMVNNFIKPGLDDLSVSRSNFTWGVPVPGDPNHVIYVWIDALSNYITALGYPENSREQGFEDFWPADLHLIAKEIVRFHSVIWFAMLMALDIPLPKKVIAHGWILFDGEKISKRAKSASTTDPVELIEKYGVDALKYFLLSEFETRADGQYTEEILMHRINSDLANDFGNLVSRSTAMVIKYRGGTVPARSTGTGFEESLDKMVHESTGLVDKYMNSLDSKYAMSTIFDIVRRANKYIDETMPWVLAKSAETDDMKKLDTVLYTLVDTLRSVATLIRPFMPATSEKVADQIGAELGSFDSAAKTGLYPAGSLVKKGEILFPRIDIKAELEK